MRASPPIRLLSERDVKAVGLSLREAIALIEQVYRLDAQGRVEVPAKIGVHPRQPESLLHAMPAWIEGASALGMKWVSYFPGNTQRGLPDYSGIIILNDPESGLPLCVMEAMHVTFLRTAACATVAAKHVLPSAPKSLGLIGCGRLARSTLRTMLAAFPGIESVCVASRTAQSRETFCAEMAAETAASLTPVEDARMAIQGIDVVVSAIPPTPERPVQAQWLSPGSLFIPLDILHSWQDDVLASATRVIADDPANFASRLQARRPQALPAIRSSAPLQGVVAGFLPRARPDERTFAVICGIASTDVMVAWEIYRRACDAGLGKMLALA